MRFRSPILPTLLLGALAACDGGSTVHSGGPPDGAVEDCATLRTMLLSGGRLPTPNPACVGDWQCRVREFDSPEDCGDSGYECRDGELEVYDDTFPCFFDGGPRPPLLPPGG